MQISEMAADGSVDFAIATGAMDLFSDLIMLPCYNWNRCILVPKNHPLCQLSDLTIQDVAKHPLVTYVFGFTGRSKLDEAFMEHGLAPRVVFTAADADVIKTYVRLAIGIGIVAKQAYDPVADADLVALDARHLFKPSTTRLAFRRGTFLRGFMYDFIELFAPHLTRELVDAAFNSASKIELDELLSNIVLPEF